MSATLKLKNGLEAVINEELVWTCADDAWEATLNAATARVPDSGADPNPALTRAAAMAELWGGMVIAFDPTETDELTFTEAAPTDAPTDADA